MEQLFGGGLDDVVVEIFIVLPAGDLANCRKVCKLWRRVVDLILRDDKMLRDWGRGFCSARQVVDGSIFKTLNILDIPPGTY